MLNGATSCTKDFIPITFREITLNPQIKLAIHETYYSKFYQQKLKHVFPS